MLTYFLFRSAIGVLLVLHGLVHVLYAGHAWGRFELQPGLAWPEGSWAFTKVLGRALTRTLAGFACALAAVGLMVGGLGLLWNRGWAGSVVLCSLVLSALVFILFWDGDSRRLDQKGAIGLLIDIALLVVLLGAYRSSSAGPY